MIINIPLQINDELISKAMFEDYQRKVVENITKMVTDYLGSASGRWHGSEKEGIQRLVNDSIDGHIKEFKDEIIEAAATKLSDRIIKSKAGQALKESVE